MPSLTRIAVQSDNTMAFITGPTLPSTVRSKTSRTIVCSVSPQRRPVSRRELLSAAAAALSAAVLAPKAASAADFQGAVSKALFPKQGFNAPDLLPTSKVVVDREILSKKEATAALKRLHDYDGAISDLYSRFTANPQIELTGPVKSMVSISDLRNALNIVNEAIDEDSQVETDKVVRGIIQDIGELEMAGALKSGSTRTAKTRNTAARPSWAPERCRTSACRPAWMNLETEKCSAACFCSRTARRCMYLLSTKERRPPGSHYYSTSSWPTRVACIVASQW